MQSEKSQLLCRSRIEQMWLTIDDDDDIFALAIS